ncbi:hypothetical protein UY3_07619 [Chelonia mydas]|uniref:Uncharacterized protein n=1 Tax=Chelonia mydas TaxID=8469 RepID=M7C406_CHEMY|nr:hypothetical protein UY3_07619 [Chelonia mydas]
MEAVGVMHVDRGLGVKGLVAASGEPPKIPHLQLEPSHPLLCPKPLPQPGENDQVSEGGGERVTEGGGVEKAIFHLENVETFLSRQEGKELNLCGKLLWWVRVMCTLPPAPSDGLQSCLGKGCPPVEFRVVIGQLSVSQEENLSS